MRILWLASFWACAIYLCWRGTLRLARRNAHDKMTPPKLSRDGAEVDENGNHWSPGLMAAGGSVKR